MTGGWRLSGHKLLGEKVRVLRKPAGLPRSSWRHGSISWDVDGKLMSMVQRALEKKGTKRLAGSRGSIGREYGGHRRGLEASQIHNIGRSFLTGQIVAP